MNTPRVIQQRGSAGLRFSAFEEKVLWGDLADLFHLVYTFSQADDPVRKQLAKHHFDAIYLQAAGWDLSVKNFGR